MRVVGCLMGGAAGFALGGPVGLLIGTAAGGAASVMMRTEQTGRGANGVLCYSTEIGRLGAVLINIDGPARPEELRAFREVFPVPLTKSGEFSAMARKGIGVSREAALEGVADLLDRYRSFYETMEVGPRVSFGRKMADTLGLAHEDRPVSPAEIECERLVADFLHIAMSDGDLTSEEAEFCRDLALLLGLSTASFDRLLTEMGEGRHVGPWAMLGVSRTTPMEDIRAAWRDKGRKVHPDAVSEASPAIQLLAQRKMAALNEAWESIRTGESLKQIGFIARMPLLNWLFNPTAPRQSLRKQGRTLRIEHEDLQEAA
ncbi:MAG: hypothetical protein Alpg2KO_22220 [Alphaproteobacteria bacterium]